MIINAGYVLSVVLAAGHHLLLSHLHGRNIESYSQFWVKNASNGFASVFSICLAYTAKIALDQAVRLPSLFSSLTIGLIEMENIIPEPFGYKKYRQPFGIASTPHINQRPFTLAASTFDLDLGLYYNTGPCNCQHLSTKCINDHSE